MVPAVNTLRFRGAPLPERPSVRAYSEEHLGMFKRLLNAQRKELLQDAEKTVTEMNDHDESFADPSDRASWESEANRDLRIRDRERKLVEKIDEALARIADGSFGECDECGEMISVGRLKARPVTTLCIQCKSDQERKERQPNHSA